MNKSLYNLPIKEIIKKLLIVIHWLNALFNNKINNQFLHLNNKMKKIKQALILIEKLIVQK